MFAQINGPKIKVVLDVEPIRPGEDECAAGLRLLGRLRRGYGPRFIDGVTVDGWYAQGPFLRAVDQLGWQWVAVLKREDMDVYPEAQRLSRGQQPGVEFDDEERERQVQLWEVKDLEFSEGYGKKVRVVRSQEPWEEKHIRGGKKSCHPRQSQWVWAARAGWDGYAARVIYQAGHRRWGIENKAFNELTQGYALDHCYHHEPVSMLAQRLMLVLGFTLFTAFAPFQCKLLGLGQTTLKGIAEDLNLALEADVPWEQWFQSG